MSLPAQFLSNCAVLGSVLLSAQKGEIHTIISANWAVLLIKWPAARPFAFLTQRSSPESIAVYSAARI